MASGRKPVWLEEEAHLLIKQYSKLAKTSMTEATSQLVLQHITELEGGDATDVAQSATTHSGATKTHTAQAARSDRPTRNSSHAASKRVASSNKARPAKNDRAARTDEEGVRYLGGIWLV